MSLSTNDIANGNKHLIVALSLQSGTMPTEAMTTIGENCIQALNKIGGRTAISDESNDSCLMMLCEAPHNASADAINMVKALSDIRKGIYTLREDGTDIVVRAAICDADEAIEDAQKYAMAILDETAPMQVTMTPQVTQDVEGCFSLVDRLPVILNGVRSLFFYLHLPLITNA